MDQIKKLSPPINVGDRLSVRTRTGELIGFVTSLDPHALNIVDRRGTVHTLGREQVIAARHVGVSLGRDPFATPPALLDDLAQRAEVSGTPWLCRISTLLQGRTPPVSVPPHGEWAEFSGVRARFEGEWVTLTNAPIASIIAAAWWATRMGARSVQVRCDDITLTDALVAAGFGPAAISPGSP